MAKITKQGFFRTWKEIIFNPTNFFEKLPKKIKYKEPSLFYVKLQLLISLLALFFVVLFVGLIASVGIIFNNPSLSFGLGGLSIWAVFLIALFAIPFTLLFSWLILFLATGLVHLFVLLFGGRQGYVETFKTLAYSSAPMIGVFVPFLGWFAYIYCIVLQGIGIHKRHKLSLTRSLGVILLPVFIIFLLLILLYFFISISTSLLGEVF